MKELVDKIIENKYRFLIVPLVLVILKIFGSIIIYNFSKIPIGTSFWMSPTKIPGLVQNEILLENVNKTPSILYIFVGWDTAWYMSIAFKGYGFYNQSYAFWPLLPWICRVIGSYFNQIFSIVSITIVSGILWVPIFQKIAENYMNKFSAFIATLVFSISPFTFLFTTVAYSESIFLLFTLEAYLSFINEKYYKAAVFAFLSTLSRPPGFLIAVPMFLEILKDLNSIKLEKILASLSPILSLTFLSIYGLFLSGKFNPWMYVTEWNSLYTLSTYLFHILPKHGFEAIFFPYPNSNNLNSFSPLIWISLLAPIYPIYRLFKMDKPLFIYSVIYFLGIILFGTVFSYPRFFSFLFPIWLTIDLNKKNNVQKTYLSLIVYLIFSFLGAIKLWIGFISGTFIS